MLQGIKEWIKFHREKRGRGLAGGFARYLEKLEGDLPVLEPFLCIRHESSMRIGAYADTSKCNQFTGYELPPLKLGGRRI